MASADVDASVGRATEGALVTVLRVPRERTCHLTLAYFTARNVLTTSSAYTGGDVNGRGDSFGRLAAVTQMIFGTLIGVVASFGFEPGYVPRGAVLLGLYVLPGIIGWLAIRARRPALLLAAGLISFVGAFIAFSGVTLIFLAPALLFLVGAAQLAWTGRRAGGETWRMRVAQLGLAAAIVVLVVAAGASALLITDSGCWSESRTANGVRIDLLPYSTGEMSIPGNAMTGGCSTGWLSARGVGLGLVLGSASLGLAVVAARRRIAAT